MRNNLFVSCLNASKNINIVHELIDSLLRALLAVENKLRGRKLNYARLFIEEKNYIPSSTTCVSRVGGNVLRYT